MVTRRQQGKMTCRHGFEFLLCHARHNDNSFVKPSVSKRAQWGALPGSMVFTVVCSRNARWFSNWCCYYISFLIDSFISFFHWWYRWHHCLSHQPIENTEGFQPLYLAYKIRQSEPWHYLLPRLRDISVCADVSVLAMIWVTKKWPHSGNGFKTLASFLTSFSNPVSV